MSFGKKLLAVMAGIFLTFTAVIVWSAATGDKIFTKGGSHQYYNVYDEDAMGSDDALGIPTQQSTKAYVDAFSGGLYPGTTGSVWHDVNSNTYEGTTVDTYELSLKLQSPGSFGADLYTYIPSFTMALCGSTLVSNAPSAAKSVWLGTNGFIFEGTTADGNELKLNLLSPGSLGGDLLVSIPSTVNMSLFGSTLVSNAPSVAKSVWAGTNTLIFEGTTADGNELKLGLLSPGSLGADLTCYIPSNTSTVLVGSTLMTNAPDAAKSMWSGTNAIYFEGNTADAGELTLTVLNPGAWAAADFTITVPNFTSTLVGSTLATNVPSGAKSIWTGTNAMYFEGNTADGGELSLTVMSPGSWAAADFSVVIPNANVTLFGSTLATNKPDASASVWSGTNTMIFEGTSVDNFEVKMGLMSPGSLGADRTIGIPSTTSQALMGSTLTTNQPDVSAGVWGGPNGFIFEGTTADGNELKLRLQTPGGLGGDRDCYIPSNTSTALVGSTLLTNSPGTAGSVWTMTDAVVWEGNTVDANDYYVGPGGDAMGAVTILRLPVNGSASNMAIVDTAMSLAPGGTNTVWFNSGDMVWEGNTEDAFEVAMVLGGASLTTDTTIRLPQTNNTVTMLMVDINNTTGPDTVYSAWFNQGDLYMEGATADGNEARFSAENPTTDNWYTFPDRSGHVPLIVKQDATASITTGGTTTAVAGSTLVLTAEQLEAGKSIRVECSGTMTGNSLTKSITLLAGGTVLAVLDANTSNSGDWNAHFLVSEYTDQAHQKTTALGTWENALVGTQGESDTDDAATTVNVAPGITFTIQLKVANTHDTVVKEQCVWELLP